MFLNHHGAKTVATTVSLPQLLSRPQAVSRPELLSRPDAADYVGVKPQTLAVWASTGRYGLRFIKVGRLVKYRREDLDRFLAERTVTSTGKADELGD